MMPADRYVLWRNRSREGLVRRRAAILNKVVRESLTKKVAIIKG